MTYNEIKTVCHVRAAIFRVSKPEIKYYKNHTRTLDNRVSDEDKNATDWEEYDPRESDSCSLFMFND